MLETRKMERSVFWAFLYIQMMPVLRTFPVQKAGVFCDTWQFAGTVCA